MQLLSITAVFIIVLFYLDVHRTPIDFAHNEESSLATNVFDHQG